ncbi:hypothetical protein PUN28_011854 [Cardiocondyla obscurior]|uniref:Uncharacterized protein n=1 Tax=Cardiocondyla obscurior TaxID=286306 RepID=A0AAW2FG49_9HYME
MSLELVVALAYDRRGRVEEVESIEEGNELRKENLFEEEKAKISCDEGLLLRMGKLVMSDLESEEIPCLLLSFDIFFLARKTGILSTAASGVARIFVRGGSECPQV